MSSSRLVLILIPLLILSVPALGDTLWLNNGDRISGTIELLEGGKLVMKTELAGRVRIDVEDVGTFDVVNAMLIKAGGEAERALSVSASKTAGTINVVNGGPAITELKIDQIQQMLEPKPIIEDWTGRETQQRLWTSKTRKRVNAT
jgi:hypothetical protein